MEDKVIKKLKIAGGDDYNNILRMIEESETFKFQEHKKLTPNDLKIKLDKLKKLIDDDKSTKFDNPNDIETQIGIEADVNIILKSLEQIVTEDNLIKVFADSKPELMLIYLLSHENYDLVLSTTEFISDLIDFEENFFDNQTLSSLANNLIAEGMLQNIATNFEKFKNEDTKDSRAIVFKSLKILENVLNLDISQAYEEKGERAATILGEKTLLVQYLIAFICTSARGKQFNANRLYSSEILSILMIDSGNQKLLGKDRLMTVLVEYLRNCLLVQEFYEDEKEIVYNVFDVVETGMLVFENSEIFIESEGLEVMIKMMKKKQFYSTTTLKVLNTCTSVNPRASYGLLRLNCLALFFPILQKKALKSKNKETQRNTISSILSILYNLVLNLSASDSKRILLKLKEKNHKNLKKILDYKNDYSSSLDEVIKQKDLILQAVGIDLTEDEAEKIMMEKKLENGLMQIWYIRFIIIWLYENNEETSKFLDILLGVEKVKNEKLEFLDFYETLEQGIKDKIKERVPGILIKR